MITLTKLAVNYAIFALIESLANMGVQDLITHNYSGVLNIVLKDPL